MTKKMSGVERIAAELARQTTTPHHDDTLMHDELAWAATWYVAPTDVYAMEFTHRREYHFRTVWPSNSVISPLQYPQRPPSRLQSLVMAGALIASEIDRLLRRESPADNPLEERPCTLYGEPHPAHEWQASILSDPSKQEHYWCRGAIEVDEDAQLMERRCPKPERHHAHDWPSSRGGPGPSLAGRALYYCPGWV